MNKEDRNISLLGKMQAVVSWQLDSSMHKLTCGAENSKGDCKGVLLPFISNKGLVVLKCPICNYTQEHIPNIVLDKFSKDIDREGV